jgi:hypothetical protein
MTGNSLDLEWSDEAFLRFAEFHVSAVSLQMHVEQNLYSFSDFSEIVTSLRNSDSQDFLCTRLFHRADEVRKYKRVHVVCVCVCVWCACICVCVCVLGQEL